MYGFPVGHDGRNYNTDSPLNHKGATEHKDSVLEYIQKEKKYNSLIGPFDQNPLSVALALSPLNTIEKKDSQDRRVILDLSFPPGLGVNGGISKYCHLG